MTTLSIAAADLARMVRTVEKSAAKDDSRPVLAGIHAVAQDGKLTLTTADGYRLSTAHAPLDVDTDASAAPAILNRVALLAFAKSLKPKHDPTATIDTDADAWTFRANGTRATVPTIAGTYPDTRPLLGAGDESTLFAINPRYLHDLSLHAETVKVSRARDDASAPLFVTSADGTERHIIMPMVISDDAATWNRRDDAPAPVADAAEDATAPDATAPEPDPVPVTLDESAFRSIRAARERRDAKRAARLAATLGRCDECDLIAEAGDRYCAHCGTPLGTRPLDDADTYATWPATANVTPIRPDVSDAAGAIARYSGRNQARILSARPDATDVRTFNQWLAAGRVVMKGEHGVAILAPKDDTDTDGDESRFKRIHVFDVSQTQVLTARRAA